MLHSPSNLDSFSTITVRKEIFPEFTPSSYYDLIQSKYIWPHTKFSRRLWEYLMFVASILIVVEMSYVLIFDDTISVEKYSFFFVIDILQMIDNFVILRTPFLRNGILVSNVKDILLHYGVISYVLHVFATIPLGWIGLIREDVKLYSYLSINRLLRLHQAWRSYHFINSSAMYAGTLTRLLPNIFVLFFIVHIFACIFFLIAKTEGLAASWIASFVELGFTHGQLYTVTIYFVLTTILTIGYGDIHPVTSTESVACIVIQITGVAFEGFLVAKMVSMLDDKFGEDMINNYLSLQKYLKFKEVDAAYHNHIRHYFQNRWEANHGAPNWGVLLKGIPTSIKSAVKLELCQQAFSKSDLFKGMRQKYMLTLLDTMDLVTYIPGQLIFEQGELATDLIIFQSGIIETIHDGTSIGTVTADSPFIDGERSLFFDEPRTKTLRAVSFVDGWVLHRDKFTALVNAKKKLRKLILENAKRKFPADMEIPPGITDALSSSEGFNELSSGDSWLFIQNSTSSSEEFEIEEY